MLSELPYVAFLAAVLVVVPLPWHWRAGNVATLSLMAWLFVVNVIYGVDAIIWRKNVAIVVPVWCDITTKIIIGAQMALPAGCMCICIHLARVASGRHMQVTRSEKRRRQIIEGLLCFGVPIIWMVIHYTVQGHRFDIIEYYGCRPNVYVSIPSILLIWVPPLILATITLVFAAVAFGHFLRNRITFASLLENSCTGLTTSHYLRLMLMSVALMVVGVVSTCFTLWYSTLDIRPWTGWASVHSNFSRIGLYLVILLPPHILTYYYVIWMLIPVSSFVFFVFFAFGRDATLQYGALVTWVRRCVTKHFRRSSSGKASTFVPSARIPISISISAIRSDVSMNSTPTTSEKSRDIETVDPDSPRHDSVFPEVPTSLCATFPSTLSERVSCIDVPALHLSSVHPVLDDFASAEKSASQPSAEDVV